MNQYGAIDWTNSVLIVLIHDLIIGFPLAIYCAIVASRFIIFHQELQRAREAIINIVDRFWEMENIVMEPTASLKCAWLLLPMSASMRLQLGQTEVAAILSKMSLKMQDDLLGHWRTYRASVKKSNEMQVYEQCLKDIRALMLARVADLEILRPNYWVLLGIPSVGKVLTKTFMAVKAFLNAEVG